jgi:hypothetical protein
VISSEISALDAMQQLLEEVKEKIEQGKTGKPDVDRTMR